MDLSLPVATVFSSRRTTYNTSTTLRRVVECSGNCSGDAHLLVSPPRAHPPLLTTLTSSRAVLPARVHFTGDATKQWARLRQTPCVVVVQMIKATACLSRRVPTCSYYGGRVPVDTTSGHVPMYRALKNPHLSSSAARNEFLNRCNYGSTTVFSTTAPVELAPPAQQGRRSPCPPANVESPWSTRPWGSAFTSRQGCRRLMELARTA